MHFRRLCAIAVGLTLVLTASIAHAQKKPARPASPLGQIVDADGRTLGPPLWDNGGVMKALVNVGGTITTISVSPYFLPASESVDYSRLVPGDTGDYVYFTEPDCVGQAFIQGQSGVRGSAPSVTLANGLGAGHVYIAGGIEQRDPLPTVRSAKRSLGGCESVLVTDRLNAVVEVIDLSTLFTVPYSLK